MNAIGTLYGPPGPTSSIPLAFNDAMWEKYKLAGCSSSTDPMTRLPSKRNMFFRPKAGDPVLSGGAFAVAGIESLQKMGATFLMCNNAFQMWVSFLSGQRQQGQSGGRSSGTSGQIWFPASLWCRRW